MLHPATHRSFDREDIGDITVVRFTTARLQGEDEIRNLFRQVAVLVTDAGRRHLILNFQRVEFLDSSAVGQLIMLNRKVQGADGRLALCHLTSNTRETFETMHLTDVFNIYDAEQEALDSF
jgi:anti-sigma B factor antagonist